MHTLDAYRIHLSNPAAYAALMDDAKQQALQARREAQQAFWAAAQDRLRSAWRRWRQAAQGSRTAHSWEA